MDEFFFLGSVVITGHGIFMSVGIWHSAARISIHSFFLSIHISYCMSIHPVLNGNSLLLSLADISLIHIQIALLCLRFWWLATFTCLVIAGFRQWAKCNCCPYWGDISGTNTNLITVLLVGDVTEGLRAHSTQIRVRHRL